MRKKEAIILLKQAGIRNSQIAELLGVSRQYVHRICTLAGLSTKPNRCARKNGIVTVSLASELLGIPKTAIRRYSDSGTIPSFRSNNGRGTRLFKLKDLWSFLQSEKIDELFSKNTK